MARTVEYPVILTVEEKAHLRKHTAFGKWGVRAVKSSQILLKADTSENAAFSWMSRYRRLSKDYEGVLATSQSWCYLSMIRLMIRRIELSNFRF